MKFLKALGIVVAVLALIILVGGIFLPKTYSVSRSTIVKASESTIYNNIANFNEFLKWNPWSRMEPTAKTTISGPIAQKNHLYQWVGKETGSGQMKIIDLQLNEMVDVELKFIEPFESLANTKFEITSDGANKKVTWSMSGDNDLMGKWMGVFMSMDSMIGKDFEDGLKNLKEKSELGK